MQLDTVALEHKVKAMYRAVALQPQGEFHFEMGRTMAERLGYAPQDLDAIPAEAIDSFAGGATTSTASTASRASRFWQSRTDRNLPRRSQP